MALLTCCRPCGLFLRLPPEGGMATCHTGCLCASQLYFRNPAHRLPGWKAQTSTLTSCRSCLRTSNESCLASAYPASGLGRCISQVQTRVMLRRTRHLCKRGLLQFASTVGRQTYQSHPVGWLWCCCNGQSRPPEGSCRRCPGLLWGCPRRLGSYSGSFGACALVAVHSCSSTYPPILPALSAALRMPNMKRIAYWLFVVFHRLPHPSTMDFGRALSQFS